MSRFSYKARNREGVPVTGIMEAESPEAVALQLSQAGAFPVTITRQRPYLSLPTMPRLWEQRVRTEELIFFTRQFATLFRAGIPLIEALSTLAEQTRSRALRTALKTIQRDVEAGSSLSQALADHPRIFSGIYLHTVRAAEAGGFLDQALTRLAAMLEHEMDTRRRIMAGIRYPLLVLATLGIGFGIVVIVVIPKFALLYGSFKASLPWPTRLALTLASAVRSAWPFLLVGMVIALVFARWAIRTPWGRQIWDDLKLRIPVLGPLLLKLTLARLAHIFGTLTTSAIPIVPALEITAGAVGNSVVGEEINRVRKAIEEGSSLAEPLAHSPLFPPVFVQMVAVGEKTGELDQLLPVIGEHYDSEASYTIRHLTTYLEPILLVVMAVLIFFLALAIFLPLWDMVRLIRR
ncbi:MAG: type II secretion system F family protein [Candidatus Methylomirabilales bacterium]